MFSNKVVLITGGTGSFGNTMVRRFLSEPFKEIRIFSRDEKKQDDMRHEYANPRIQFHIGDIRDRQSVDNVMAGVNYIFHAAALKQVPSCEFFPIQAVQTNILGTNNVLESAIAHGVERIVVLSTDKACYPINAMGMSKALMEKVAIAKGRSLGRDAKTIICCTRYGNVMSSRGSVIPLFVEQIKAGKPLTVTDPEMTRFMMSLDDAVDLVIYAFQHGVNGDLFVQKAPAATIETLARALIKLYGAKSAIKIIGTRHGEKKSETLITREEMFKAVDIGRYYRVPADTRDLNYEMFLEKGEARITQVDDYQSCNTHQLDIDEMIDLLKSERFIREDLGL
ncbi:MAG: polysaccharide biosynthesis protein [Kiritimatiellae bacterium]|nr:polysaccharide biosynthesis protein [Kiritimatiellia bacterium]